MSVDLEQTAAATMSSLGSTVGTFANEIQRKLREQEQLGTLSRKDTEGRHGLMLKAMTTIRKALQDAAKINLGARFTLSLEVSDWEGWPRVELDLVDSLQPESVEHGIIVSANDLNGMGTVQIALRSGTVLGKVQLVKPDDFARIPIVLKKSVRQFLDQVAPFVLNPKQVEEKPLPELDHENAQELDEISKKLQDSDVFSRDDEYSSSNMVEQVDEGPISLSHSFAK